MSCREEGLSAVECEQRQRCLRGQSFNIDYKLERGSGADRLQLWVCSALKWPAPVGWSQALAHEDRLQLCARLWERMSRDATATEPASDRGRDLGEPRWESCQRQLLFPLHCSQREKWGVRGSQREREVHQSSRLDTVAWAQFGLLWSLTLSLFCLLRLQPKTSEQMEIQLILFKFLLHAICVIIFIL